MTATTLQELLALPGPERVELGMALWQSLKFSEQEHALAIDAALSAELEQRWARHEQHPEEAIDTRAWYEQKHHGSPRRPRTNDKRGSTVSVTSSARPTVKT